MLIRSFAVSLLFYSFQANAEPVQAWIAGSYVNVRETSLKNAPVLDRLTINTPVMLVMQSDGVCEITWGVKQKGFVACDFLRNRATSIDEVKESQPGNPNPNYSATRAFWLQPTFSRLVSVAQLFEATLLSAKQRKLEQEFVSSGSWENPPSRKRVAIPELDAMKAVLSKGVIAPRELWTPPPVLDLYRTEFEKPSESGNSATPLDTWLVRQIKLEPTSPSFFKSLNDIGGPKATPEELSAQFGIAWKMQVTEPSGWTGDSNSGPSPNGVWDIGVVTQRLEKPVYALAVSNTGKIAIAKTDAEFNEIAGGDNGPCSGSVHIQWPEQGLLPGYTGFSNALTLFRSLQPLHFTKAKISIKQQRLSQPKNLEEPKYSRASLTYMDLDGDGVDDIVVWNAVNTQFGAGDGPEGSEYKDRFTFVNVKGRWHLLDRDVDDPPCGC